MVKPVTVSTCTVVVVVTVILTVILGYVVFEYGFAAIPQFLLVAFWAIVVVPLILLFFGS